MRHFFRPGAAALLPIVLCLAANASAHLLSNGDFSQWDDDSTPASWTVEARDFAAVNREDGQGHNAAPSLQLIRLKAGTGDNKGVLQNVPVTAGQNYTVGAWMLVPTMPDTMQYVSCRVIITWRNALGLSIGSTNPSYIHQPVWTNQSYVAAAPNSGDSVAASADVLVRCYSRSGSIAGGIAYIDDVSLDEGGAVGEPGTGSPLLAEFRVGPNPMAGDITVSLDVTRATNIRLRVYDLTGTVRKEVFSGNLPAGQHTLVAPAVGPDRRPLAEGLYFLVLSDANGDLAVRKLVLGR